MALVIKGADLNLEVITNRWLAQNDPEEPIRNKKANLYEEHIEEISLHTAIKRKFIKRVYDPTDLLVDEISFKDDWGGKFEAENYRIELGDEIIEVGMTLQIKRRRA